MYMYMPNIPIVMSYVHVHVHIDYFRMHFHICTYIHIDQPTHAHGACRLTLGASTGCKSTCFLLREPFAAGFKERRLIQNCFIYFIMLWNFCIVVHFVLCVSLRFGLQFFLPPWLLTPWRAFRSHTWHRSSKPSRLTWQLSSVDGLPKWWFQSTALSGSLQVLICFCFLLGLFCFLSVVYLSK